MPVPCRPGATVTDTEYIVLCLPCSGSSSQPSTSLDASSGVPMAKPISVLVPSTFFSATTTEPSVSSSAARISAGGVRRAGSYTWYSMSRIAGRSDMPSVGDKSRNDTSSGMMGAFTGGGSRMSSHSGGF